jgi:branched-chain amino acid transport system permease protein
MKRTIVVGLITLVCLVLFAFVFPSGFLFNLFTQILIMGLFASSLNLLIGYTGMVSFGHAAFFGLGAYTAGILLQKFTSSLLLTLFCTILFSTVAALIIGFFCIRLGSIYFAMLTLAFNQIAYIVIVRWTDMTGGDQGLIGGIPIPPLNLFGVEIILSNPRALFILTTFIVITCLIFCKLLVDSPFGAILRVIRENADRAYALGIRVKSYQLIVFVVAGVLGGLSGGLMALFISGAYPDFAYWSKSAEPIFMVVVGGMSSFLGPMLGAAIFTVLIAVSTMYTNLWGLIIGSVLVLVIILARKGLADYLVELLYGMGLLRTSRNSIPHKNG